MPLSTGHKLGPYEILGPLGKGGMGEVYKARDTRLDRIIAVKISKPEFSERFEREARAAAALNHPNICQLYDVGPNYLVMELIEGGADPLRPGCRPSQRLYAPRPETGQYPRHQTIPIALPCSAGILAIRQHAIVVLQWNRNSKHIWTRY